ncbi:hypothetical protein L208DRAFT_372951 [Tricholoma matsutake]|nr:hypothetical protein L208DRAFT_372951 [Tricholoma matsutake 945]
MTVSPLPMFSSMNLNTYAENIERIFLCPRPYAQLSGQLLLLPLLPYPKPLKPLPSEIWTEIFAYVLQDDDTAFASPLLRVCKAFKVRELPNYPMDPYHSINHMSTGNCFATDLLPCSDLWYS